MDSFKKTNGQHGISLVEILVAVLILGGGALGVASLQLTGLKYISGSQARTQATLLANDVLDRMRSNLDIASSGSNYNTQGFQSAHIASKDCYANECSPSELADFDKQNWLSQVTNLLPSGQAKIEGLDSADDQRIMVITLQWRQFNELDSDDETKKFEQLVFRGVM